MICAFQKVHSCGGFVGIKQILHRGGIRLCETAIAILVSSFLCVKGMLKKFRPRQPWLRLQHASSKALQSASKMIPTKRWVPNEACLHDMFLGFLHYHAEIVDHSDFVFIVNGLRPRRWFVLVDMVHDEQYEQQELVIETASGDNAAYE